MNLINLQDDLEHVLEKYDIPYEFSGLLIGELIKNGLVDHLTKEEKSNERD